MSNSVKEAIVMCRMLWEMDQEVFNQFQAKVLIKDEILRLAEAEVGTVSKLSLPCELFVEASIERTSEDEVVVVLRKRRMKDEQ